MSKSHNLKLNYKGFIIRREQNGEHDGGLVCLTDMWKAKGSVKSQETDKWLLQEHTCNLMLQLVLEARIDHEPVIDGLLKDKPAPDSGSKKYRAWASQVRKLAKDIGLLRVKGGKGGGTYAIDKLAIAYAESLSAEFHSWALSVIKERIEEEADPELGIRRSRQRAVTHWERLGKSPEYIGARLDSIPKEDYYESVLQQHGVTVPKEFAWCKTMVYKPLIGIPNEFRSHRGLKKGQNLKDGMTIEELATTDFAKILSAKRINTLNPKDAKSCASISYAASHQVANLLNQS